MASGDNSSSQSLLDTLIYQARQVLNILFEHMLDRARARSNLDRAVFYEGQEDNGEGKQLDNANDLSRTLRAIGDQLDNDEALQRKIASVAPTRESFFQVARDLFSDGIFNWGRVVALFYFGCRLIVQSLDRVDLVHSIIFWVIEYFGKHLVRWVASRGGWSHIVEWYGSTTMQIVSIVVAAAASVLAVIYWNRSITNN